MNVEKFIYAIRNSDEYIKNIYLYGGCYRFHLVLKEIFPQAKPLINKEKTHVVSDIDGEFYDIEGINRGEYFGFDDGDLEICEKWSFSKNYVLTKPCEVCFENINIEK